eukprot:TRINITY_DN11103_c0_g3_i3.p1 TRINITY_DN11103_c0_g3~~TRINITY_DN11103_c0_g3_i3.p1  ORF type:complete len:771 (+),score=235.15 TRINITY_DN11103_c0_g3_i3:84-2396(+)
MPSLIDAYKDVKKANFVLRPELEQVKNTILHQLDDARVSIQQGAQTNLENAEATLQDSIGKLKDKTHSEIVKLKEAQSASRKYAEDCGVLASKQAKIAADDAHVKTTASLDKFRAELTEARLAFSTELEAARTNFTEGLERHSAEMRSYIDQRADVLESKIEAVTQKALSEALAVRELATANRANLESVIQGKLQTEKQAMATAMVDFQGHFEEKFQSDFKRVSDQIRDAHRDVESQLSAYRETSDLRLQQLEGDVDVLREQSSLLLSQTARKVTWTVPAAARRQQQLQLLGPPGSPSSKAAGRLPTFFSPRFSVAGQSVQLELKILNSAEADDGGGSGNCIVSVWANKADAAATSAPAAAVASAAATAAAARMQSERALRLEEAARRLRANAERVRCENRRARIVGVPSGAERPRNLSDIPTLLSTSGAEEQKVAESAAAAPSSASALDSAPSAASCSGPVVASGSEDTARRLGDLRRKIAALDEVNELERARLLDEQREVEARRRAQEDFERTVRERTERELREHEEREAQEAEERNRREEAERREREERELRRQDQLRQEELQSRKREEQRREGKSEATQLRWQAFEAELDRQWAEQEAEERRRLDDFARDRMRLTEEWNRRLNSERQRFASEAEFRAAARQCRARHAARADEQYYGPQRGTAAAGAAAPSAPKAPPPAARTAMPPGAAGASAGSAKQGPDMQGLCAEERAVLRELQALRGGAREAQKAKVKELLFRWHPDKNPGRPELATRLFQFVQKQRELVLGL